MDIEKLIDDYQKAADKWEKRHPVTDTFDLRVQDALRNAATALSALHAENEKLRAELEQVKRERDEAVKDLRVCSIENRMECQYCLYRTARSFCWDCTDGSNWQWRGVKEENNG